MSNISKKTPADNVVPAHWISPGISFRNPGIPHTVTRAKKIPWFMSQDWKPMPRVMHEEMGPGVRWEMNETLPVARPYWRRKFKDGVLLRMDHSMREIPSFQEMGLGDTPTMTEPSVPTSERGFWGNMQSVLLSAGSMWQDIQKQKIEQKAATERARIEKEHELITQAKGVGMGTVGVLALVGIGAAYLFSRG